jgi:hypothetical protein
VAFEFWAWFKQDLEVRRGMKMGPHQPKRNGKLVDFRRILGDLE